MSDSLRIGSSKSSLIVKRYLSIFLIDFESLVKEIIRGYTRLLHLRREGDLATCSENFWTEISELERYTQQCSDNESYKHCAFVRRRHRVTAEE